MTARQAATNSPKHAMRPSDLRKAMLELNAAGNRVELKPDGTLVSVPLAKAPSADVADLIDWSRKK